MTGNSYKSVGSECLDTRLEESADLADTCITDRFSNDGLCSNRQDADNAPNQQIMVIPSRFPPGSGIARI